MRNGILKLVLKNLQINFSFSNYILTSSGDTIYLYTLEEGKVSSTEYCLTKDNFLSDKDFKTLINIFKGSDFYLGKFIKTHNTCCLEVETDFSSLFITPSLKILLDNLAIFDHKPINLYSENLNLVSNDNKNNVSINLLKNEFDIQNFKETTIKKLRDSFENFNHSTKIIPIYVNPYDSRDIKHFYFMFSKNKVCEVKIVKNTSIESTNEGYSYTFQVTNNILNKKEILGFRKFIVLTKIEFCSEYTESLVDSETYFYITNKLFSMNDEYLKMWEQYNNLEYQEELINAKKFRPIKIKFVEKESDYLKLNFYDDGYKRLKALSEVEDSVVIIGSNKILALNECNNFSEYEKVKNELISSNEMLEIKISSIKDMFENPLECLKLEYTGQSYFHFNYIIKSMIGSHIAYKRRQKAKNNLMTNKSPNKFLYELFSKEPKPGKSPQIQVNNFLISKQNLTSNQQRAILIAAETPDIAIIQGPPGTGKTTVISEIINVLNENVNSSNKSKSNLLSAFRTETVTNLTEHASLFGLPSTLVVSKSDKENKENKKITADNIKTFIIKLKTNLLSKYPKINAQNPDLYLQEQIELKNCQIYSTPKSIIFNKLKEFKNKDYISSETRIKIETFCDKYNSFRSINYNEHEEIVDFLYNLPETNLKDEQFANALYDSFNFKESQLDLIKSINKKDKEVIDDLSKLSHQIKETIRNCKQINYSIIYNKCDSIGKLKETITHMFIKYLPKHEILFTANEKKELSILVEDILGELHAVKYKGINGEQNVIFDFIQSLNEDPTLIQSAITEYSRMYSATNQISSSKNMFLMSNGDLAFDNVVIDEAATSSPLDLFIPMSLCKEKLILVGDHRQLPNIINDSILNKLYDSNENDENMLNLINECFKKTLFEYFIDKCKLLTAHDGKQRVITLNTQFRMHPKLGKIVSDLFYKNDGGVTSSRPETDFTHNYANMQNRYLHWLNYKFDPNQTYRKENSRINNIEANQIAQHILEAIKNNKANNLLNIGIICIYRPQVKLIIEKLEDFGVFTKTKDQKSITINENYKDFLNISIGTVDSFQGKEFDFVYLALSYSVENIEKEKHMFSRMNSEIRDSLFCVALSRQKKLLIVCGDLDLYLNQYGKDLVYPIYYIADICKKEGWYE